MSAILCPAKSLRGELVLPGDKSISHRAIMLSALAKGESDIKGVLECDDCAYTANAFRAMGVTVTTRKDVTVIRGRGLRALTRPQAPLSVGQSGTTMRILAGILAGQPFETTLTGDEALLKRPMERIVAPLTEMGVRVTATAGDKPPLVIHGGKVRPIAYRMPVASAQVKSAILFAGLYADGTTTVMEPYVTRDHTERMMQYYGVHVARAADAVSVRGMNGELPPHGFEVPGDMSSAAFFMVAATVLKGSHIRLNKVSINPTRAGIIAVLKKMGADIRMENVVDQFEPFADIEIRSAETNGIAIDEALVPNIIDELPIIFVLGAFSKGVTVVKGVGELRVKETDRIASMAHNLRAMGVEVDVDGDAITIHGAGRPRGGSFKSFGDHRTCMSMAVAALAAEGESEIDDLSCVAKSFPAFFDVLKSLAKL